MGGGITRVRLVSARIERGGIARVGGGITGARLVSARIHRGGIVRVGSCRITGARLVSARIERGGIALSYSRNQHNIVEQLSFKNIKSKQKMWYI